MLVLTRRKNEKIQVSVECEDGTAETFEIVVTEIDVQTRRVKLGFNAKSNVKIHRSELLEKKETR